MTTHALTEAAPTAVTTERSRRVLLKLSGEVFGGGRVGVDPDVVRAIARQIAAAVREGIEVAVVVGGGNFFRGAELQQKGMERSRADYMGMLGTVMNCLALQDFLEKEGIDTRVQTAITMGQVAEPYIPRRAIRHLEKGRVVIFGAGAGMPYFSTDTVSAQRALECKCDAVLMSKNGVDGVYDADPRTNPDARKLDRVTFAEALRSNLRVVDAAAFSLCMENQPAHGGVRDGGRRQHHPRPARRAASAPSSPPADRTPARRLTHWTRPAAPAAAYRRRAAPMIDETLFEAEEKMEKAVEVAKEGFAGIRTGRAHPGMFQKVLVDYYGAPTPLQQLASFQNPEARTIIISPFDKGSMHAIEKAIQQADLGVNPSNDGNIIRCVMPVLTEERRREYVKMAHHQAEDAKVSVRNIRRHAKTHPREARQGRRGRRGRGGARREGARDGDEEARRPDRRAAQAQGSRAARGLSRDDDDRRPS